MVRSGRILNEDTAPKIWANANDKLKSLSAQKILKQFQVRVVGTTDDPCDDLAYQAKVTEGETQKQSFSVGRGSNKTFLRLKAKQTN
jgi:glucuronate isomerase